jgi:DNA-binding response OmpR family regulator
MTLHILFIEDEVPFREALCDICNLEGFAASGVGSIQSFRAWRHTHRCDVLVVDRNLPDGDGLQAVALHRADNDGPVIVLTARGQLDERLQGLNADADYYLHKPVAPQELVALLHRLERKAPQAQADAPPWLIDEAAWHLHRPDGSVVELTRNEVQVLACFVEHPGVPKNKADLIVSLGCEPDKYDPRRLEVLMRRLRNKIEASGCSFPLSTIYGVGYSFNARLGRH